MGNLFIEILETNKNLISVNLVYNRVQMKTIEEINRILKFNNEKQKAKFIPNLQRDIKGLQFNPELFSFYTNNINSKRHQQGDLYKKVKKDYNHFTRLINIENKKIDKKVLEMKNIQEKISEYQINLKLNKESFDLLQKEIHKKKNEIQSKIDEEAKILKQIKSQNDFLQAEYNTNKKDLDQVIQETQSKLKISQDKLDLAEKSVKHFTNQLKKKTELFNNMNNPDMLISIKNKIDKEKKSKKQTRKENNQLKIEEKNANLTTINSTLTNNNTNSNNDNLQTFNTLSSENKTDKDKDKENNTAKNNILKKDSKKKNKLKNK